MKKQSKKVVFELMCICLVISYFMVYKQIINSKGLLPDNFQAVKDASEYYTILNSIQPSTMIMLIVLIIFYVYVCEQVFKREAINFFIAKICYISTVILFTITILGILAFKLNSSFGTSASMVAFLINLLSIICIKQKAASIIFLLITIFPILNFYYFKVKNHIKNRR